VQKEVASKASELRKLSDSKRSDAQELAQAAVLETRQVLESVRIELQRTDLENASSDVVEACRRRLEAKMNTSLQSQRSILSSAAQQLREVTLQGGGGPGVTISPGEITGALEEELLAMREAAEADAELVQLGMALAVVTHEFDAAIRTIREQLRRLKGWADASPQLRPLYQKIAASFEHLDGYLALFTPLQRRLYRNPQKISGAEIAKFADELFGARLKRHKVEFHATDAFCIYSVSGYPSTFYPVFINIIDNAIFWLKDYRGLRRITLDADELGIEITNSGPKIAVRDVEAIFDLRFSRKPGGRGMGLYISRQTLAKAGYRLFLDVNSDHPVCFRISPENGPHLRIPNGQE
jgi:signal transduction histidine kinase